MFRDPQKVNEPIFVITFAGHVLPEAFYSDYFRYPVEPYYPSPLRCYSCQKFGHSLKICKVTTSICGKCNKPRHKYSDCTNTEIECANCKSLHTAADKKCPRYKIEMEIRRLKTDQNISFQQA